MEMMHCIDPTMLASPEANVLVPKLELMNSSNV